VEKKFNKHHVEINEAPLAKNIPICMGFWPKSIFFLKKSIFSLVKSNPIKKMKIFHPSPLNPRKNGIS